MTDIAYAAGFFDGEGCIHMRSNGQVHLCISQRDYRPLQRIMQTVENGFRLRKYGKEYQLRSTNRDTTIRFLKKVLPYLTLKNAQARIVVQYLSNRPGYRFHDHEKLVRVYDRLKQLKKEFK